MKKYIVTVPDDKRALFDEIVREHHLEVVEASDSQHTTTTGAGNPPAVDEDIPWVEAKKLIERDAT